MSADDERKQQIQAVLRSYLQALDADEACCSCLLLVGRVDA